MSLPELISGIRYHLQSVTPEQRAPNGIDAALANACASAGTPERKVLEKSLAAWVALVSSKDTLQLFHRLSSADETQVLTAISDLTPSPEYIRRVESLFCHSSPGAERRLRLTNAGLGSLLGEKQPHAKKRKRAGGDTESAARAPSSYSTQSPVNGSAGLHSPPFQLDANSTHQDVLADAGLLFGLDILYEPRARNLPRIFKQRMCDSVIKRDSRAEISIIYTPDPTDCTLRVAVNRPAVPDLANNLYGIKVRDKQPGWRIEWEHGAEMDLDGGDAMLKISRCSEAGIGRWVGDTVLDALRESGRRKMEVENGDELTRLVSLTLWGHELSTALLDVKVDASNIGDIRDLLWAQVSLT